MSRSATLEKDDTNDFFTLSLDGSSLLMRPSFFETSVSSGSEARGP